MLWRCIKALLIPNEEDKKVIEAIKKLPSCAKVSGRGGFYRGPHCTKNKCRCGEGEYE